MDESRARIPYARPTITDREIRYATDAVTYGWGDNCYKYINRFEELFKQHLGVRYAVATSSCTGALHLGMTALGIGYGDEVILADTNWIATASPIVHLGAEPVFVDILQDSWCIDPDKVEAAITARTKAIVAVHLYGNLCDMNRLLAIGEKYGVPIIEDSAEAIGSVYHGQKAGSLGIFGTFSFHGTKTVTTGEGGMFVTNDSSLYEKVLTLSNHGRKPENFKEFSPVLVGFKYKISNLQAAVGCAQIERIESLIARKREIIRHYKDALSAIPGLSMNPEPQGTVNGAWMPTVLFSSESGISAKEIKAALSKNNVDARGFFLPLSSMPMFKSQPQNIFAWDIPARALNIPSFHDISISELNFVSEVILKNST